VAVFAVGVLIWWQNYVLFGVLVFLAGLLDGVDGAVARLTGRASALGGFWDSVLDRGVDVVLVLAFLWVPNPVPLLDPFWMWVFITITGVLLVSYVRSRGETAGVSDSDVGFAARSERLFILVVANLLWVVHPWSPVCGVVLVGVLAHLTVVYRVVVYRRQLQQL
jgi:phosphatidylglycerophosphate synthase